MTQDQELLAEALYALNNIPNQRAVCKDGGSSYDLAKKIEKRVSAMVREKRYLDNPDKVIYEADSGEKYTYRDFLTLAKNNGAYAISLIDRVEWQHVETLVEDDLMNDEIIEDEGTYKFLQTN